MWDWSPEARAALRRSHDIARRVDVWHGGSPVYTLAVTGGSVSVDADRPVRRNMTAALIDPTGALTKGDVDDLLNPYECEVAPYRGVRLGSRVELAPLGVFGLTGRSVEDTPNGLTISISGQDRAMGYQGPMDSALAISGGTPIEQAIIRLLSSRNPGLSIWAMKTGFTCGPLVYAPDIDVWAEASKLAGSVGARLYHDRLGHAVLELPGPGSPLPVASYEEGDGLLLSVSRSEDSDTIKNVVVAESADGSIRVEVSDDDPFSPTYARGRYGRRVATLVNPYFYSVDQAKQAATARLAYELGRSETVSISTVVDPGRDVEEVLTVHRPIVGLNHRGVVVAATEIPLGEEDPMPITCRQSRLAQDGTLLPLEEVTTS